jgi:CheY-like chemotaxis protein
MRRPNVLAVDDTTANLLALEAVLGTECNIVRATSGPAAIEILKSRHDIDVILMDVQMPMLDGFETAERIKKMESCRDIPIVFITAVFREDPWVRKGYDVGGIDYFAKPFDPDLLRLKVGVYASLKQKADFVKERERQLRLSQDLLETAKRLWSTFEKGDAGLIVTDLQGNVYQMNDEVFRIFKPAKLSGSDANGEAGLLKGKRFVCDQLGAVLQSMKDGKVPFREIVSVYCGDGSEKSILCSASTLRQEDATAAAIALTIYDITPCKRIASDFEHRLSDLIAEASNNDL